MARDFWSLKRNVVRRDGQTGPLQGSDADEKLIGGRFRVLLQRSRRGRFWCVTAVIH